MEISLDLNVTFTAKAGKITVDAEELDVFMKGLWEAGDRKVEADGKTMVWVQNAHAKLAAWLAEKCPAVKPTDGEVAMIWAIANAKKRDEKGEPTIDNSPFAQKKRSFDEPSPTTPKSPASLAVDPRFVD